MEFAFRPPLDVGLRRTNFPISRLEVLHVNPALFQCLDRSNPDLIVPIVAARLCPHGVLMSEPQGMRRWPARRGLARPRFELSRMYLVVLVSLILTIVVQRAGVAVLGDSLAGTLFSDTITILVNSAAIGFSLAASGRGHGPSRIFWFLFSSTLVLQLIANAGWAWIH